MIFFSFSSKRIICFSLSLWLFLSLSLSIYLSITVHCISLFILFDFYPCLPLFFLALFFAFFIYFGPFSPLCLSLSVYLSLSLSLSLSVCLSLCLSLSSHYFFFCLITNFPFLSFLLNPSQPVFLFFFSSVRPSLSRPISFGTPPQLLHPHQIFLDPWPLVSNFSIWSVADFIQSLNRLQSVRFVSFRFVSFRFFFLHF